MIGCLEKVVFVAGCMLLGPVPTSGGEAYDIVIYGGSCAGVAAAVQAVRMGASAVVIEPSARIGGLTTGGLGQTDIGHKEAFGGIAREFYRAVKSHYQTSAAWTRQEPETYAPNGQCTSSGGEDAMWTFEPSVALAILEGWERRFGLQIVRGERLDRSGKGVVKAGERILSICMESGTVFRGRTFIDATYEGDLMAAAGVTYRVGRESNAEHGETKNGCQPAEGHHKLVSGVDPYVVRGDPKSGLLPGIETTALNAVGEGDGRVQAYCYRMCLTDDPSNRIPFAKPADYDERNYELLFRNFESGERGLPWINSPMPNRKTDTNNRTGFSTDFIGQNYRWAEASYAEREKIAAAHLSYQRGLMWTLANHPRVPEAIRREVAKWGTCRDEFLDGPGDGWPNQLYVREARRMVGSHVMTEHHCLGAQVAARPVAMAAYGMDSHHVRRYVGADGCVQNEGDVEIWDPPPKPYGIDYGAVVPRPGESDNLLVPICLSATHIAFGSIRMEPVFFALGQAVATAAVLAVHDGCAVQSVDYGRLRDRLLADGQVLPGTGR